MGEHSQHLGSRSGRDVWGRVALIRHVMRVCLPEEIVIALPGLGDAVLRPAVCEIDASWLSNLRPGCEEGGLECADSAALLLVERGFALHMVNALLGHEPVIAADSLSRVERGVFYGALAALLVRLGPVPAIRLHMEENWVPNSDSIGVEVSLRLRGVAGRAWLGASAEFLARILTTYAPGPGQAPAMVCVELGRTRLPISDLTEAKEGDLVIFDGVAPLPSADPWPVHLCRGDVKVLATLRPDGVVVASDSDNDQQDLRRVTKCERRQARGCPGFAGGKTDACAEIAAEIGRIRGAALASLLCGEPLDRVRDGAILLRRDGTSWAEGEIFAVEGEFAVRITRKLAA